MASRTQAGGGHFARSSALASAIGRPVVWFLDPTGPDFDLGAMQGTVRREDCESAWGGLRDAALRGEIGAILLDSYVLEGDPAGSLARSAFVAELDDGHATGNGHVCVRPGFACPRQTNAMGSVADVAGPQFALIDGVFSAAPPSRHRLAGAMPRLLVNLGARDSRNVTGSVLTTLKPMLGSLECVTVVLGRSAPHRAALEAAHADKQQVRFADATQAHQMRGLYCSHDAAVGAGGVALLERMASGLPSLLLSIAGNQDGSVKAAAAEGAAIDCGAIEPLDEWRLRGELQALFADDARRTRLAARGRELVDGKGAQRVAATLETAYRRWGQDHVSL